jgi:hypothetical protein
MRLRFFIPLFLFIILRSAVSSGEIFKWVDDSGGIHYTDDYTSIPEKFRLKIIKLEEERSPETIKGEEGAQPKKKENEPKDRMGRGEEYWRGRVEEIKKKMRTLQDRDQTLKIQYNELTTRYNDSKSSVERGSLRIERERVKSEIDQNRSLLDEARMLLEKKIPEEADFYKAKPEWVRP